MGRALTSTKAKPAGRRAAAARSAKKKPPTTQVLATGLAAVKAQQKATGEILRVMAESPGDVLPVLNAVARHAARLCDAPFARILLVDGEVLRHAADYSIRGRRIADPARPVPLRRTSILGRAALERKTIHITDLVPLLDREYPDARANAQLAGFRTILAVPLLREGKAIGGILVYRRVVHRFTRDQVALVETFARQAAIAIESVRLFRETRDALDQQTATAEILQVISSSPGNLQPVLETVVHAAARFCGAHDVMVLRLDNGVLRGSAGVGAFADTVTERYGSVEALEIPATRESVSGRCVVERRTVHVHDLAAEREDDFPVGRELQRRLGHHTVVTTPLLREGVPLGVIALFRNEVKPFSDRQIQLLRIFADQAVIAIENVRLFTELGERNRDLSEALEQQTATSEILRVISGSQTDVKPVFDTIVRSVLALCDATFSGVYLLNGETFSLAATAGLTSAERALFASGYPRKVGPDTVSGRAALECRVVQSLDLINDPEYSSAPGSRIGARTVLGVPMLRDGAAIGSIGVWHSEVRPFSDAQIALLRIFADQAVIAIENVRLFTELQARNRDLTESLERQTATSDVLRVIARSPTDTQPVFDLLAQRAGSLCNAEVAVVSRCNGDLIELAAIDGLLPEAVSLVRGLYPMQISSRNITATVIRTTKIIQIADVLADRDYVLKEFAQAAHYRAGLGVPIVRDEHVIGAIFVGRSAPGVFSESQVELLKTFADQAVIAIENVRLFKELEQRNSALAESLEQQTATSEILRVISQSQTDVQPVFDAIATAALKLCRASAGNVTTFDGEFVHMVAISHVDPRAASEMRSFYPMPPGRSNASTRAIESGEVVAIPDVLLDAEYPTKSTALGAGFRSILSVPMVRDGNSIGAINVGRGEPGLFSDKQVALLRTFADQAVIAIENVRLFTELQARNRAITEALEQQTATSEILRVISASPRDVQPVFDAIASAALKLCAAGVAMVARYDGKLVELAAIANLAPGGEAALREIFPRPPSMETTSCRAVLTGKVEMIADVLDDPHYKVSDQATRAGFRSTLAVPLMRGDQPIGCITVGRPAPGRFGDDEIGLLQTFADQAVIAIRNVQLFSELEARNRDISEALEQQTATSDILRVISGSPTDVQPVFDIIGERAEKLCDAEFSVVSTFDGEAIRLEALHGMVPAGREALTNMFPMSPTAETVTARTVRTREIVHVADALADPLYGFEDVALTVNYRSCLGVPMQREGQVVGAIFVARSRAGLFSDAQVDLLKTFSDQAVIAIENVRLFKELDLRNRDLSNALDQQTATGEILRVISSSQTNVQPVFDAIVKSAVALCGAEHSLIFRFDGEVLAPVSRYEVTQGLNEYWIQHPMRPGRGSVSGRATLDRRTVHVHDVLSEPDYEHLDAQTLQSYRTVLSVPMLRDGTVVGVITSWRNKVDPFSEKEIELVETFADQAAIAVENVRLFTELEARTRQLTRSVGELKALGEVGQAVSSTLDLETVLSTIVTRATQLAGMDAGAIYEYDEQREEFFLHAADQFSDELVEAVRATPIRKGEGALGRLAATREPVQVSDIADAGYQSHMRDILLREGHRSLLAVPLLREDRLLGGLSVIRKRAGEFAPEVVALLQTFASQSALAIQNARLFHEIEDKSRQLETASRHKSEFLANMSHELRTPLNAIIGFSEVLSEKLFGEINAKQEEYVNDILESGRHLLDLINDILDLSKIEAGRMELELADFQLSKAVENALTLVRERASRHGIKLDQALDGQIGTIRGDERKVKQVLLNLLSNALKFTPEGGHVEVRVATRDGMAEIAVTDTGVGIALEDQETVFEEFRQVGASAKKREGTGLGLAISRKFIELHGGRIWVESQLGKGSTFAFTLPLKNDPPPVVH